MRSNQPIRTFKPAQRYLNKKKKQKTSQFRKQKVGEQVKNKINNKHNPRTHYKWAEKTKKRTRAIVN